MGHGGERRSIVQEAGGRFTGLDGAPGPYGGNAAASNGLLHEELLGYLNRARLVNRAADGVARQIGSRAPLVAPRRTHVNMRVPPLVNL